MPHVHYREGEHQILEVRRHPIVLVFDLLLFAVIFAVPLVIGGIFLGLGGSLPNSELALALLVLGGSLFYLFILLFALHSMLDYALDIWLVTNQRVINVEQKGLFGMSRSEQELNRIQDVTAEVNGIIPTIFNYGNVYIQTAAEKERFVFKQIYRPDQVVKAISKLVTDQGGNPTVRTS